MTVQCSAWRHVTVRFPFIGDGMKTPQKISTYYYLRNTVTRARWGEYLFIMRWTSSISQHYTRFCVETFNYLVLRWLNIGTKLHKSGDTAASLVVCLIIHVSHFTPLHLLSPVVHSWQFAGLSDCSIWGPPCRAWCRRSAPRWRPAARRTRRGWGCRTRWGPPGDLNNAASSAILQKVMGKGFWFLTNA